MGTGKEQAELWGPGARDWSDYNEPMCTPFYQAALDATGVGPGTALLDIGCGGGFALLLAARRGATVSGLDATPALLDIARERVPAAVLAVGDLEDPLPFEPGGFDVVTAFNSIQYAADPVAAVKNMSQLVRPRRPHQPAGLGTAGAVRERRHVRRARPAAAAQPRRARRGAGRHRLERGRAAGAPGRAGRAHPGRRRGRVQPADLPGPGDRGADPAQLGPARAAIQHSGLAAVRGALTRAFAGSRKPDGTYRQDNVFRYLVART